ncbi:hypothetical protein ACOMHN_055904 [Nucella lapillus]
MGRTVYCDEIAQTYIDSLIKKGLWHIGLIIGQLSHSQKDYVALLCRTPEARDDEVCEVSEVGKEEQLPSQRKTSRPPPSSLQLADDIWVATHAKQVTRMLPGGLDVVGIFVIAPSHILKDGQAKLRQMLFAVHKAVAKTMSVLMPEAVSDRILLQIDSLSSKVVCSSFDTSNQKSSSRPAEWRVSGSTRWLCLQSPVALDVLMPQVDQAPHHTLLKSIQHAIGPFCQSIIESVTLISGEVRDGNEMLATFPEGKKGKAKDKDVKVKDTYHVDFLLPMCGSEIAEPAVRECGSEIAEPAVREVRKLMSVRGIITCRAFVHWKATVTDAVQAIKTDVVRSLCSRSELLSEDLELTDEISSLEFRQLYDTPVRVFTAANASGAQICDYVFQDEKPEEVIDRMHELLDLTVTPEDLDMSCERPARENDWVTASHSEHSISSLNPDVTKPAVHNSIPVIISVGASVVIAVTATILSYVFMELT